MSDLKIKLFSILNSIGPSMSAQQSEDISEAFNELDRLRAEVATLKEQNALLTVQKEEVMRAWADALIEEIDAIPCRYHGDPSYDHDAYWMKGAVKDLIGKMMKWPPIPVKDRYIPDSECSQGKCANPTTGCFGKCYIAQHPEWPNVSLPAALPQQVKSEDARDAARYRYLRNRDIENDFPRDGLFIGCIPDNAVLSMDDADAAIDAAIAVRNPA